MGSESTSGEHVGHWHGRANRSGLNRPQCTVYGMVRQTERGEEDFQTYSDAVTQDHDEAYSFV